MTSTDPRGPIPKHVICHCAAYKFPHRSGSGKCENTVNCVSTRNGPWVATIGDVCACCGLPAEAREIDIGIGAYEYWGSFAVDTQWVCVSECCEAGLVPATLSNALSNWRKPA